MTIRHLTAGTALALSVATTASAQEVTWAFSHWVPPQSEVQVSGFVPWVESINEASEGRIQIDIFPAQQLGAAPDHYDMARDGIVDIGFVNPGYQAGRFPIIAAAELPFLTSNATGASRALHEWYAQYAEQEMPDVKVCLVHLHNPGTLHATRGPIAGPEDFAGMNIRPPQATIARMISLMGASPVQVPAPEMRAILSSGGADATVSPWQSLELFGVEDVVTHHLDMPLYGVAFVYAINQGSYDALSEENRAVIDEHCTPEWSERIATGWDTVDVAAYQRIKTEEEGHSFYTPNEEQMAAWMELSEQLRGEWVATATEAGLDDAEGALADLVGRLEAAGGGWDSPAWGN
ncbi:TRAP transporter substrate-binding protein [Pararhodobacter marinus]|uniref:C4-dicarboxylate ABC transporter n=1 Tax=Pararhodobacter marinus TaxID=2184063 RepID=A0A2U2CD51_9RHOB|nr:TRAP transporter substrate-binding protein [Pararhodobacter marinus]PWE29807.1 C4-dicarboxylate ABC transporter [Pararhodobacter marinus]